MNWCRSCFFTGSAGDSEADIISTKGVHPGGRGFSECIHCQPLQAVLCAAFAVKSARHYNVFPLFGVDVQRIGHKQMESTK